MNEELKASKNGDDRGISIAIDASRNRSGGAKAHLLGILRDSDPRSHGISCVHVWSYDSLLQELPDVPWLIKHNPPELQRSLLHQLWWQRWGLAREISEANCRVLLSTDAGTICRFLPSIVMSRDMLSFEGKEMQRYPLMSSARLRLFLLRHMQIRSLRRASGALFLTDYASEAIQRFTGQLDLSCVIPHGIGENFKQQTAVNRLGQANKNIVCMYVSNVDMYKHQWHVVRAIAKLRKAGYPVQIKFVGGGVGPAKLLLDKAIVEEDPEGDFVEVIEAVPHSEIPAYLAGADIFIFASSCENMPNTLVEAMAFALPIASSNRGPMPEILKDGGTYFDPENPTSIAAAVEELIVSESLRNSLSASARSLAGGYSWSRCAHETWEYLIHVADLSDKGEAA